MFRYVPVVELVLSAARVPSSNLCIQMMSVVISRFSPEVKLDESSSIQEYCYFEVVS
jgi:hypothetical protein